MLLVHGTPQACLKDTPEICFRVRKTHLCPFLRTDIGDTTKDTLQRTVRVPLRIGTEENPSLASNTALVDPRSTEAELSRDRLSTLDKVTPYSRDQRNIRIIYIVDPILGEV